ncbi:unnamed protein product [marine sediment metagenome]|uniref:Uncharacterized protein n=1 Tax=marine sediment metagenome TaxID=412755 RepID=X1BMW2_9ZZZZ
MGLEINLSYEWKDRILDLLRFAAVSFMWWVILLSVNHLRHEPFTRNLIIVFMGISIFIMWLMGEYARTSSHKVYEFERELNRLKKEE